MNTRARIRSILAEVEQKKRAYLGYINISK